MAILKIDACSKSKSGKSFNVRSADRYYLAKLDSGIDKLIGQSIDCEITTSEFNGVSMHWINKYSVYQTGTAPAPTIPETTRIPAPSNGDIMRFMPFVSNCCAHAIAAGRIEGPHMISAWAKAAYEAALALEAIAAFRKDL